MHLGVDLPRSLGHHPRLRAAKRRHRRADLAIEIDQAECVHIGDVEGADAEAHQGHQVEAADPAHPGDRDALTTQRLLFPLGQPAEVSAERLLVREIGVGLDRAWCLFDRRHHPIHPRSERRCEVFLLVARVS